MRRKRNGASLLELIVALAIGALVLQLALKTAASLSRAGSEARLRSDQLQALLLTETVLREEVRRGDVRVWPDSIGVRAVRGLGVVCGATTREVVVRWRGARRPNPAKDSVELVTALGSRVYSRLVRASTDPAPCNLGAGYGDLLRIEPEAMPLSAPVIVRVYEAGSYHIGSGALRYRSGRGGRQPLTPEVFADSSGFTAHATTIRVDLWSRGASSEGHTFHIDRSGGGLR